MKAIGFMKSLPIENEDSLFEFDTSKPKIGNSDILVKISAVSVNPVDSKVRNSARIESVIEKNGPFTKPKILGYDAVGSIIDMGVEVKGFTIGERVYYAGDITKQGSNAEFQAVDYRLVGHAPQSLTDAQAAALPLTSLTAMEAIFDQLKIEKEKMQTGKTLLIIGGAGGVGSIATQIAKQIPNLNVISTASRDITRDWVKKMGADKTANHYDLINSVRSLGIEHVDYIFNVSDTTQHWDAMVELIAPFGRICCIVSSGTDVSLDDFKQKSVTFSWEFMFTRSMYHMKDIERQGFYLNELAKLIDNGKIVSTVTRTIRGMSASNFRKAHKIIESRKSIGKTVIIFKE